MNINKRKVIFRADGGPTIGMGHFIRTVALAEMLNEHFYCIFATIMPDDYQIQEIEKVCHSRFDLPEDESHFNVFLDYLKGDEIVVLDNYYFTTEYQKAIKAKGCKLVCIDDMHDKHYVADVVINHAEGFDPSVFSIEANTKLLLGYSFALLRKELKPFGDNKVEKKFSCLIMMGGTDPLGITSLLLKYLEELEFEKPVAIINYNIDYKQAILRSSDKFVVYRNLSGKDIAGLMRMSDFGIFPASTVAIEATASRLPFICGYFIDNQIQVYEGIKRNQLAVCIGNYHKINKTILVDAIKSISSLNIRESIIKRQIDHLDGNAPKRYVELFLEL